MDSEQNINELEENTRFGDYEIVKPIGKGKFAIVYRAKHIHSDEVVALKRINVDLIDNKTRDKCLKEVKLLQSLDHPNIIRYLDSFITENDLVIIVEWAAAGDLKRQLRKQLEKNIGFEERLIWKYFSQICDAIQHMHERRVMHRDLKPANIFLTLDGTIKVGDLGLSRELSEHTIQAHSKVGTPLYMSPEVLRGDGYDFKSDVWSLGCLLYELAMLKSPFKSEGLKLYALFQKISQGDYQPLPETYSETLRNLTHSLLLTKPEDRPDMIQICEIAKTMRTETQEAYVREKRLAAEGKLKRQSSSDISINPTGEYPNDIVPANHRHTPKSNRSNNNSRRNSEVQDMKPGGGGDYDIMEYKIENPMEEFANLYDRTENNTNHLFSKEDVASPFQDYQRFAGNKKKGTRSNRTSPRNLNNEIDDMKLQQISYQKQVPFRYNTLDMIAMEEEKNIGISVPRATNVVAAVIATDDHNLSSHLNIGLHKPMDRIGSEYEYGNTKITTQKEQNKQNEKTVSQVYHRVKSKPQRQGQGQQQYSPYQQKLSPNSHSHGSVNNNSNNINKIMQINTQFDTNDPNLNLNDTSSPLDIPKEPHKSPKDNNQMATFEKLQRLSSAIPIMDILYSKLLLLEYLQEDNTLLPIHFAVDMTVFHSIAGYHQGQIKQQYRKFADVTMWLINRIIKNSNYVDNNLSSKLKTIDLNRDSPVMVCKQLLSIAQDVGIAAQDLSEITPTVLSVGYGDKVCQFLLNLASLCLTVSNFKPMPTQQVGILNTSNEQLLDIDQDNDHEDEQDVDENLEEQVEENNHSFDDHNQPHSPSNSSDDFTKVIVMPSINPKLWLEELERVSSSLTLNTIERKKNIGFGWQSHITDMIQYNQVLKMISSSSSKNLSEEKTYDIIASLGRLSKDIDNTKSVMIRVENMINSTEQFAMLSQEYNTSKKILEEKNKKIKEISQQVEKQTEIFSEISEKYDQIKEELDNKTIDDSSNGTSRLLHIKEALKVIKDDIKNMDISIGLVSNQILQIKQEKMRRKLVAESLKKRRSNKHRLKKHNDRYEDQDDDDDEN